MAPLIRNMSWQDVQWVKFKRAYMYNTIYHLRRTKFVVYQLATLIIGIGNGLGTFALKQYNRLQHRHVPGFPDASIDTSDFVSSFAFNIFSCVFLGLPFGAALVFDLFWPEREEARSIQWTWKLSTLASTIFQLAASLATTVILATHGVHIHDVSVEQEKIIRGNWNGPPLLYHQEKRALAAVVFCWVGWLFTFWSTITMWRSYAHNNKYGPFADHVRKERSREALSETDQVLRCI